MGIEINAKSALFVYGGGLFFPPVTLLSSDFILFFPLAAVITTPRISFHQPTRLSLTISIGMRQMVIL